MPLLLACTIILAPTYAIRFSFLELPLNVLMLWVIVVWLAVLVRLVIKREGRELWSAVDSLSRPLLGVIALFFIAGLISLFVGGLTQEKVGQFLVLFIQPLSLFFIIRYSLRIDRQRTIQYVKTAAYIFLAVSGVYAIIQYLTLIGVPVAWWGNANEPKRALAFFLHPNFYSLFVTPLLAFLVPDLFEKRPRYSRILFAGLWGLGAVGLLLSLSRGGWLGLFVATTAFVVMKANRKLIVSALAILVVAAGVVAAVPNFRYRVLLPFHGEKSSVARFSLWNTGWKMVMDSPIAGKGLLGFSNNWDGYNTDANLEHYPAPHNIILNFWVDTGLLGLISFLFLSLYGVWVGIKNRSNPLKFGLVLFLVAIIIHGLIDIPYFKNDLALLFWMVYALAI
jgi:putative inorganic carbon (hco3(-)) transporter